MSDNATPLERDAQAALTDYQRIAARMYTLDANMGRRFLADGELVGRTADIAAEVNERSQRLWSRFDWLRRSIERIPSPGPAGFDATTVRTVAPLLSEDVVPLRDDGTPAENGDATTSRVSLAQLASGIETESVDLLAMCQQVDGACADLADRVAEIDACFEYVEGLRRAEELPHDALVDRMRARRDTDVRRALGDPLTAVEEQWLRELGADIRAYAGRLTTLDEVRQQYPTQATQLREQIAALSAAEHTAMAACELATAKIADPPAPRLNPMAPALSGLLMASQGSADVGDWAVVARQLSDVGERLATAAAKAERAASQAQALLDRRTELRGRFSAYTAKAARLGAIEEPATASVHAEAQRLLQTAPCDLPAATRALHQFQLAIQASTKEARR